MSRHKLVERNAQLPKWAQEILFCLYGGKHHWPSVYEFGHGYRFSHLGELATYDDNQLTRLVVEAHKQGVRVSVSASGPMRVGVEMFQRERRVYSVTRKTRQHPSLRLALEEMGELAEVRTPPSPTQPPITETDGASNQHGGQA